MPLFSNILKGLILNDGQNFDLPELSAKMNFVYEKSYQ